MIDQQEGEALRREIAEAVYKILASYEPDARGDGFTKHVALHGIAACVDWAAYLATKVDMDPMAFSELCKVCIEGRFKNIAIDISEGPE